MGDISTLHQICTELRAALSLTEPRPVRDLLAHCPSAETTTDLSRGIYAMRKAGEVEIAGTAPPSGKKGSTKANAYVLTEKGVDAHLAAVLESDLGEYDAADATTTDWPLLKCVRPVARKNAFQVLADRHIRSQPEDFVEAAIERLEEPHIVDAATDARRLRRLAASPLMRREPDLIQWLEDLAEKLDRRAA